MVICMKQSFICEKWRDNMNDVGIVGLGVMGRSLAINMANNGFKVSGYNRTDGRISNLLKEGNESGNIYGAYSLEELVSSLKKPRVLFLMTKSGTPVDEMIDKLLPLLDDNDIIIDGGNSHYEDTIRRNEFINDSNKRFLGIGVSGGESGALNGPSIMVGGNKETYLEVENLLNTISAGSKHGHCSTRLGNHGAGHYVKMVHNGIEYGMMQAIAETYDILKSKFKLSNKEISSLFAQWNEGELNSYLMEITVSILLKKDEDNETDLVEMILDKAEQNGTGAWTMESAIKLGIPTPTLNAAVVSRNISHFKELRQSLDVNKNKLSKALKIAITDDDLLDLERTLIFTNYLIFSQGLWLIGAASKSYDFEINLIEVLKVWSNGCIIRAELLDEIIDILKVDHSNITLLNNDATLNRLVELTDSVSRVVEMFNHIGISAPAISSSLDYFYSMTNAESSMNLIQAQRDYFGSHTYKRVDKEGTFHSNWEQE